MRHRLGQNYSLVQNAKPALCKSCRMQQSLQTRLSPNLVTPSAKSSCSSIFLRRTAPVSRSTSLTDDSPFMPGHAHKGQQGISNAGRAAHGMDLRISNTAKEAATLHSTPVDSHKTSVHSSVPTWFRWQLRSNSRPCVRGVQGLCIIYWNTGAPGICTAWDCGFVN